MPFNQTRVEHLLFMRWMTPAPHLPAHQIKLIYWLLDWAAQVLVVSELCNNHLQMAGKCKPEKHKVAERHLSRSNWGYRTPFIAWGCNVPVSPIPSGAECGCCLHHLPVGHAGRSWELHRSKARMLHAQECSNALLTVSITWWDII